MPIEFYCSGCQSKLRTPDSSVGKGARCPSCGSIEIVPATSSSAPSQSQPGSAGNSGASGSSYPLSSPNLNKPDYPTKNPFAAPSPQVQTPHYQGYRPRATPQSAKAKLMAPAIIMIVLASFGLLSCAFGVIVFIAEGGNNGPVEDTVFGLFTATTGFFGSGIVLAGGISMLRLKPYWLAITGAITMIVSGLFCCIVPAGFGIWSLVVLLDYDVKKFFR